MSSFLSTILDQTWPRSSSRIAAPFPESFQPQGVLNWVTLIPKDLSKWSHIQLGIAWSNPNGVLQMPTYNSSHCLYDLLGEDGQPQDKENESFCKPFGSELKEVWPFSCFSRVQLWSDNSSSNSGHFLSSWLSPTTRQPLWLSIQLFECFGLSGFSHLYPFLKFFK